MAIAVVASGGVAGNSVTAVVSGLNTTGSTMFVVVVAGYNTAILKTYLSDSEGNSAWEELSDYVSGTAHIRVFYHLAPTTSASHTFTFSYAGSPYYPGMCVVALSGTPTASAIDSSSGASDNTPGPLTPGENGCMVLAAVSHTGSSTTVDDGFTEIQDIAYGGGGNGYGTAIASKQQTTAASANPAFTGTSAAPSVIVAIKAAAVAGGVASGKRIIGGGVL